MGFQSIFIEVLMWICLACSLQSCRMHLADGSFFYTSGYPTRPLPSHSSVVRLLRTITYYNPCITQKRPYKFTLLINCNFCCRQIAINDLHQTNSVWGIAIIFTVVSVRLNHLINSQEQLSLLMNVAAQVFHGAICKSNKVDSTDKHRLSPRRWMGV